MDHPPFPGFRPAAFKFLRELKTNNDRDWFKERKDLYDQELVWPLKCLVAQIGSEAAARGLPLIGDPKNGLFRIYRDVRFSKNKDPYKVHVSAVVSRDGTKKRQGALYLHLEPRNCFSAAGFWQPESGLLGRWRERMAGNPKEFLAVVNKLDKRGLDLREHEDSLKRLPRGFEDHAGSAIEEYLKRKSFIVVRDFLQKDLQSQGFVKDVIGFAKDAMPLLDYGWELSDDLTGKGARE